MKWILFFITFTTFQSFAEPPKKAHVSEVKTQESFSLAELGLEAEAFRIQHLVLKGKSTFMAAKLVNGILSTEKPISSSAYQELKKIVQPLLKMESNEDCKAPVRFTFRTSGHGDDQLKLCLEKSNVSSPMKRFNDKARNLLGVSGGKVKPEKAEAEAAPTESLEKLDEPLPE